MNSNVPKDEEKSIIIPDEKYNSLLSSQKENRELEIMITEYNNNIDDILDNYNNNIEKWKKNIQKLEKDKNKSNKRKLTDK